MSADLETKIINGQNITIIRKKIKNIYLYIKPPHGTIFISAPKRASLRSIEEFIVSREDWIKKNQIKISNTECLRTDHRYETGEYHDFLGKKYLLEVVYGTGKNHIEIVENYCLKMCVNRRGMILLRKKVLYDFYKKSLKDRLPELIIKWQKIINVTISELTLKAMKSRWGSCNISHKKICLNIELAKKHEICLEYVLVHEFVHLLERCHNKKFYNLMTKYMPNWREYDGLLNAKNKFSM